jgi:phosphosulfolactate synthase (CoM biosynthesis protein A)
VKRYFEECRELGFDIVEVSSGFLSIPLPDLVRLVERVRDHGMKAKPEVGIQFGAGGASSPEELEAEGTADTSRAIRAAKAFLAAGAPLVMIESEGITESVRSWRTDVAAKIADEVGLDKVMFEAADPAVFSWYVKNFGPDVNLFVDHSQIVQLECLRSGIWGTAGTWGRIVTFKEPPKREPASRPRLVDPRHKAGGGRP